MAETFEATKDTSRAVVFGAVATIATYVLNLLLPDLPVEVQGAVLVLLFAGITWVDSYIHNSKKLKSNGKKLKSNGLLPF